MPYINKEWRDEIDKGRLSIASGELNYEITKLIDGYITRKGLGYGPINDAIGALECAKLELYRRVAAPYEDKKARENGDVYVNA